MMSDIQCMWENEKKNDYKNVCDNRVIYALGFNED